MIVSATKTKVPRTLKELGLVVNGDIKLRSSGQWRTESLFHELTRTYPGIWTVRDYDYHRNGKVYPTLRPIYLECEDPTEYSFAIEVFGEWEPWKRIRESKTVQKAFLNSWREELDVRLISKGLKGIINQANKKEAGLGASKYLVERGWLSQDDRGRPSQKRIAQEAKKIERVKDELEEELERAEKLLN